MQERKHNETTESIEISEDNGRIIFIATAGSRTERGGRVTRATGTRTIVGHRIARVGDTRGLHD